MGRFDNVPLRHFDVQFSLCGEDWRVSYGNTAWRVLKGAFGVATEGACVVKANESEQGLVTFLQAGLAYYHPGIGCEQARALYDEIPRDGERALASAAWDAVTLVMPDLKDEAAPDPKEKGPKSPQTRTRSSKRR